uniref:Ammonium transporter 3 member 1 n=1 Tax=Cajanus cajan TaxID=3821 RepID=A0A151RPM3_CAJCA|nr:Ammonium transporter 3 member 1 [Cajanus cajan]
MGHYRFQHYDLYAPNTDLSMVMLNTNICIATSLLVGTWLDIIFSKKPSVIGVVQGIIIGFVCIPPKVLGLLLSE